MRMASKDYFSLGEYAIENKQTLGTAFFPQKNIYLSSMKYSKVLIINEIFKG